MYSPMESSNMPSIVIYELTTKANPYCNFVNLPMSYLDFTFMRQTYEAVSYRGFCRDNERMTIDGPPEDF